MSEQDESISEETMSKISRITAISIEGFKSIRTRRSLPLGALNILAGANSAGKSSFIQPLLLIKQTLEASYDPGPLLIDGSNIKFTDFDQIFSKSNSMKKMIIGLNDQHGELQLHLGIDKNKKIKILKNVRVNLINETVEITEKSSLEESALFLGFPEFTKLTEAIERIFVSKFSIIKSGPFLFPINGVASLYLLKDRKLASTLAEGNFIHVPGLRGNPERSYKKTAVGSSHYRGTFDVYVASIIADWQESNDPRLLQLGAYLQKLGLTGEVEAKKHNDTSFELLVGRLPAAAPNTPKDLVSIADVGFGVSQVLPVLVALLVAEPGQLVYIEQPETHLHPKAQRALAEIFAEAATRQATIIVESHSMLFVRSIQTLVAQKKLDKELVKLHWVSRDAQGDTDVSTCDLDDAGAYGDWPQDFDATAMDAELEYIGAAEKVLFAP